MREIKFRAWNEIHECMIFQGNDYVKKLSSFFKVYEDSKYLMQFTGLLDKNGVEIYEGDIVRWVNGLHYWEAIISTILRNKSNTLYAVETFHNCTEDEDKGIYTFERSDSRKGARNELEFIENIEVIGNIHQNPEILK